MTHSDLNRFSWMLMFVFWLWPLGAQAQQDQQDQQTQEYRYKYVNLSQVVLPPGYTSFFPAWITNSGKVYGTVDNSALDNPHVAIYKNGILTALQPGFGGPTNEGGTVGGSVFIDPVNFYFQATLFKKDNVKVIPLQPGKVTSTILSINDPDTALVESLDASNILNSTSYTLYSHGKSTLLDFGPTIPYPNFINFVPFYSSDSVSSGKFINNEGVIAGTNGYFNLSTRGFRFDPKTGQAVLFNPLPQDTITWGLGINNRGNVLGYSFVIVAPGAPYHESIGVWDSNGVFHTYFYETISSRALVFNDNNLIVITLAPDNKSYLVPQPGVRLDLADLVQNLPSGQDLKYVFDINNNGDMIGFDSKGGSFLLQRIDDTTSSAAANPVETSSSGVENTKNAIPTVSHKLRRFMPPSFLLNCDISFPKCPQ